MLLKTIIVVSRFFLHLIARIKLTNFEALPRAGGVIVVTNHLGRLDAILGVLLAYKAGREDIILMIAEKYQKYALWRWFARKLNGIWLNRFEADFHALRLAYKRLRRGGLLALAPEGTRSPSGTLAPGKSGAAYMAYKSGMPILPAALTGTEDRVVKSRLKRLRRLDIGVRIGEPFYLPPRDGQERDRYLQEQTDEIMCRIAALLPPKYRGVYADHPRLLALLQEEVEAAGR